MSRVTVSMADVILSCRGWIFLIFSAYTMFLMYPHRKKSSGERSGLRGGQGIGPFLPIQASGNLSFKTSVTLFSESTITGVVYLDLLEQYVFPQIETFEQENVNRVIFMQDGAPPHFSCFVTDILNKRFPNAWIGRNGPIPWPPRSPDLSPLDFFLWGYIKNIVYAEKIRNIQHLQERITSAIETITRDMIQKTWQKIEFRLDVSRATKVAHIEMY